MKICKKGLRLELFGLNNENIFKKSSQPETCNVQYNCVRNGQFEHVKPATHKQ
jgi:hypothetical protein